MKPIIYTIFFSVLFLGSACDQHHRQNIIGKGQDTAINEITLDYDSIRPCRFSEFVESNKIIVLDDKNGAFIGNVTKIVLTKDQIIITDNQTAKIFFYDFNGNLKSVINSRGKGPKEYIGIDDSWVNIPKSQVEIYDRARDMLIVYGFNGKFIKSRRNVGYILNFSSVGDSRYYYRDALGFYKNGKQTYFHLVIENEKEKEAKADFKFDFFISSAVNVEHFSRVDTNNILFWMDQDYTIYNLNHGNISPLYKLLFKPKPIMAYEKYSRAKTLNDIKRINVEGVGCIGHFEDLYASEKLLFFTYGKQLKPGEYSNVCCIYSRLKNKMLVSFKVLSNDIDGLPGLFNPEYINDSIFIYPLPQHYLDEEARQIIRKRYGLKLNKSINTLLVISKLKNL